MGYSIVDVADIPYVWGTFKFVRHHLGVTAFGFAQIDFPPDKVARSTTRPSRGRRRSISPFRASGTLEMDGETVDMRPGRYVLVPAGGRSVDRRPARTGCRSS